VSVPLSDTDPEAERVQLALLRAAPVARRLQVACDLSSLAVGLARRALRRAHPEADDGQLGLLFVRGHYGDELADALAGHLALRRG
jgi:hypothetical protein